MIIALFGEHHDPPPGSSPAPPPPVERWLGRGSPLWVLAYLVSYAVSAVSALAVIVLVLRRIHLRVAPRRGIEKLMDGLVIMVAALDIFYDVIWFTYHAAKTPALKDPRVQMTLYIATQLAMVASHTTVAAHLYALVVNKACPAKLAARLLGVVASTVLAILAFALFMGFAFGRENNRATLTGACTAQSIFTCWMQVTMVLAPLSIVVVGVLYALAYRHMRAALAIDTRPHVAGGALPSSGHLQHLELKRTSARIRDRLFAFTALFTLYWGSDAVMVFLATAWDDGQPGYDHRETWLHFWWNLIVGSAGFFNAAIIYYKGYRRPAAAANPTLTPSGSIINNDDELPLAAAANGDSGLGSKSSALVAPAALAPRRQSTPVPMRDAVAAKRIYASTFNAGAAKGVKAEELAAWIPPPAQGFDLYVISFQECDCLGELTAGVLAYLGGPDAFTPYSAAIGDATILHGKIAVVAFARTADVASGAFRPISTVRDRVARGVNLGVTKLANKGMVGLSFQFHDTSLAFVSVHYAADKKGRRAVESRLQDATKTLQELLLVADDIDFDFYQQAHHVVVLGDLNFRIREEPAWVLDQVAASIQREQQLWQRYGNDAAATWREARRLALWESEPAVFGGGDGKWRGSVSTGASTEEGDVDALERGESTLTTEEERDREKERQLALLEKSARAWAWLNDAEELLMAMREGLCFYGFVEQAITFPPSFKWWPGAQEDGFRDVASLPSLYKTKVKKEKKGDGRRPPSYTDRVLVHSLPDHADRLSLGRYELVDGVRASDHRPVALAMELLVDTEIVGFERRRLLPSHFPAAAAAPLSFPSVRLCEVAMAGLRLVGESLRGAREIHVHYPLTLEDPLAEQRKVLSVSSGFIACSATPRRGHSTSRLSSAGPALAEWQGKGTASAELLRNMHAFLYAREEGEAAAPYRVFVAAVPRFSTHALVKVVDGRGRSLGQGVLCLGDRMPSGVSTFTCTTAADAGGSSSRAVACGMSSVGSLARARQGKVGWAQHEEKEEKEENGNGKRAGAAAADDVDRGEVSVDLSVGGCFVGRLLIRELAFATHGASARLVRSRD